MPTPQTVAQAESLLEMKQEQRERVETLMAELRGPADDPTSGRTADSLTRLLRYLGEVNDEVLRAEFWAMELRRTNPEDLPEEVYVEELRLAAEGMPEAHLAVVAGVWLERHGLLAVPRDERARKRRAS